MSEIRETEGLEEPYSCSLSDRLADRLGKGLDSHVRVESDRLNAYYVVDEIHEGETEFKTNKQGLERIKAHPGDDVDIQRTVPIANRDAAFRTGDITESLWDDKGGELLITCPHGGDIEYNTDEMGAYLHKILLRRDIPSTAWMCHGFYSGQAKDAFERWHIKKPVKGYDAYPGLKTLVEENRTFRYGIGFHIHKYDYVAVGGRADKDLRDMVGEAIRRPTPSKYEIRTSYDEMALAGRSKTSSINYFAEEYQGVQIEMPRKVAFNKFHTFPEAVAEVVEELL